MPLSVVNTSELTKYLTSLLHTERADIVFVSSENKQRFSLNIINQLSFNGYAVM